jgi:hypothetical protein
MEVILATLPDAYIRVPTFWRLSKKWIKCDVCLVQSHAHNFPLLRCVPQTPSASNTTKEIELNENLKLSYVFSQPSHSWADLSDGMNGISLMYFIRIVSVSNLDETNVYPWRKDYIGRLPMIGPSSLQDIERCETVLKFGCPNSAEMMNFGAILNENMEGPLNEVWKQRSVSSLSANSLTLPSNEVY